MKPAFKMATIGTVGAKGVNAATVNVAGPLDRGMTVRSDYHHLFTVDRHSFKTWMSNWAVDKGGVQRPVEHAVQQQDVHGQDAEVVQRRLEGSRRRLLDAPVLVLLCLYLEDLDGYPDPDRQENETTMAVQSLGAAAQNALLAAYDQGLDAGWMCAPLFCPENVVGALGLDPRLVPHALLTLGYAEGDPPKRRGRRPLDELVVYRD